MSLAILSAAARAAARAMEMEFSEAVTEVPLVGAV
jgi:hypothetical protein